ncbi:hypothetical protein, partial [Phocaeicola oris]|uniref:hypothetical protein n=1 Tax=Phocaeicola oris TaxID=2896850 RepID=UPI00234EB1F4
MADAQRHVRRGLCHGTGLFLRPSASSSSDASAPQAPSYDQLQPPLPQVEEPRPRACPDSRQPAVGGGHHL